MISHYRKKVRLISCGLLISFLPQLVPLQLFALTSGPSQPEVQSFQPAGTSDMVDLFSGDFSYNIPLFELPGPNGGYPFNLSYQSGINTDQEASWVGLGWNLQPGAINRQMRGLPDEFNGQDKVETKMSMAPNVTAGMSAGVGVEFFGGDASIGLGVSVYQNNYRGAGYSIDGSVGFSKAASSGRTAGVGMNFSLDPNEGVSLSPSLSLGNKNVNYGLDMGYNSKEGLTNLSYSSNISDRWRSKPKKGDTNKEGKMRSFAFGSGANISLAHPGYTPQITTPMINSNLSATLKVGGAFWGIYGSAYVTGFYNQQRLATNKRNIVTPAFGYLNYHLASNNTNALMDVNREKDGVVTANSPNMAIPSFTYDIYSVSGQGIGGMYRPMRNDFGVAKDQEVTSESSGGSAGVDLGPALIHVGANLSLNHAISKSGLWSNAMTTRASFTTTEVGSLYEPWYFKSHGESTTEEIASLTNLGGERAVRTRLLGESATSQIEFNGRESWANELPVVDKTKPRKPRNKSIQSFTNEQLWNGTADALPHFSIDYIDKNNAVNKFNRGDATKKHHIGAFAATTPEGLRYNYGIPAYNLSQEEFVFSVRKKPSDVDRVAIEKSGLTGLANDEPKYDYPTTVEKYLRRVKTPAYAHSYLLTSILGPDYVDVTGNGVSEDDLGYWVKFTYKCTSDQASPFQWRDPFQDAHLQEGWKSDPRDDKGSFVYGAKEIWYLAKAETKSHVATFEMSAREDGKGVLNKLQIANAGEQLLGAQLYRLDKITLATRFALTKPIKTVNFKYDYSLCPNSSNSSASTKGKLTLTELTFTYGGSTRGSLNPYVFSYANNPSYQMLSYDRWGNYKPNNTSAGVPNNYEYPYVPQNPAQKSTVDDNAAAWSLNQIRLPSGGVVNVDYETDDYAYVQHKPAMQMMEVVSPTGDGTSLSFDLADNTDPGNTNKVRFRLEKSLKATATTTEQQAEARKYVAGIKQLYFKYLVSLRKPSERFYEYISGYVDVDDTKTPGLEADASGKFVYGYFFVKSESGQGLRNPFSMRAWQHLRTNQPELANSSGTVTPTDDANNQVKQMMAVGSILDQVKRMFKGFYKFCSDNGWGRQVTVGKSWVRLYSPDKKKYGGGLRVRQITMKDNWAAQDQEGVYGQVYDYTTEENGTTISSGVASYEPFVGGEENPLRVAKKFTQSVPLRSDNNLYFEYPVNESYFPGPHVGYSKVSVTSLASASLAKQPVKNAKTTDGKDVFPNGAGISYGTSGKTVHEFFTARDFPVLVDETEKENRPYNLSFNVPLIGHVSKSRLTASQGYSIVTNDMHGKAKKVSNYRQTPAGAFEPEPISWVKYNYAIQPRYYQQENVLSLNNQFVDNADGTLSLFRPGQGSLAPVFTVGQESEFFMDMRQFEDNTYTGGVRVNGDVLFFLFFTVPVFVPWPSVGQSENLLRTAVTNKVIFKSGILESTEAYDGGSLVKTSNLKWDKQTGAVLLTMVNNNFDAPVFSYNILAHQKYQGMGAAYQNTGLTFTATNVRAVPNQTNQYQFTVKETLPVNALYAGDELLLYSATASTLATPIARAIYSGEENGNKRWHTEIALPTATTSYKAMIVRSGYRNQISVSAGSVTALEDPSVKGAIVKFSKTIQVPK
jgi:hypothetical protein